MVDILLQCPMTSIFRRLLHRMKHTSETAIVPPSAGTASILKNRASARTPPKVWRPVPVEVALCPASARIKTGENRPFSPAA